MAGLSRHVYVRRSFFPRLRTPNGHFPTDNEMITILKDSAEYIKGAMKSNALEGLKPFYELYMRAIFKFAFVYNLCAFKGKEFFQHLRFLEEGCRGQVKKSGEKVMMCLKAKKVEDVKPENEFRKFGVGVMFSLAVVVLFKSFQN